MNRQAILDLSEAGAPVLKQKYAVKSLAIFGSRAGGLAFKDSADRTTTRSDA
jgi:predicted nucleotidyltransferase